jgi:phospholipid/cholesterol/gamma-HCH transport system substrate-binding protein
VTVGTPLSILARECGVVYSLGVVGNWLGPREVGSARPIEVGSTTAIVNKPDHVEVDFTVPADLDLPADVGAVTYSQSIVTDRHIELTKTHNGGPKFTGPACIKLKSTKTPISVSETFAAISKLAGAVMATKPGQDSGTPC